MNNNQLARLILKEAAKELSTNESLAARISSLLAQHVGSPSADAKRPRRRNPGPFDPMVVYRENPGQLADRLRGLTLDELKDIIAEHGMDRSKLAMKWKHPKRLLDLILTTVKTRSEKGDAFWSSSPPDEGQK